MASAARANPSANFADSVIAFWGIRLGNGFNANVKDSCQSVE